MLKNGVLDYSHMHTYILNVCYSYICMNNVMHLSVGLHIRTYVHMCVEIVCRCMVLSCELWSGITAASRL